MPAPVAAPSAPVDASVDAAGPIDAAALPGDLYLNGALHHPKDAHDDRYTCRASPAFVQRCAASGPAGCKPLPPVAYWDGELQCSGVARPPPDLRDLRKQLDALAIPACACSCDRGFVAALGAYQKRLEACAAVP